MTALVALVAGVLFGPVLRFPECLIRSGYSGSWM